MPHSMCSLESHRWLAEQRQGSRCRTQLLRRWVRSFRSMCNTGLSLPRGQCPRRETQQEGKRHTKERIQQCPLDQPEGQGWGQLLQDSKSRTRPLTSCDNQEHHVRLGKGPLPPRCLAGCGLGPGCWEDLWVWLPMQSTDRWRFATQQDSKVKLQTT